MIYIIGDSIDDLVGKSSEVLLSKGVVVAPRNKKTIELQNVFLTLNKPQNNIVTLKSRNFNKQYVEDELDWYLSGSDRVDIIGEKAKMWYNVCDKHGVLNSNYGKLSLFDYCNNEQRTQYEWVKDSLLSDSDSRQAIINYNQPRHKYKGVKDFPCALTQQFRINNNKLDCLVNMRSNDLIYGLCNDIPWFTFLQTKLFVELKREKYKDLQIGEYNHFAQSLHVYEKHFKMLEDINKEYHSRVTNKTIDTFK